MTPSKKDNDLEISNRFDSLHVTDSETEASFESSQSITDRLLEDPEDANLQVHEEQNTGIGEEGRSDGKLEGKDDPEGRQRSLEFTQAQMDELKEETKRILQYIDELDLDIQRNKYAIDKVEDRQR